MQPLVRWTSERAAASSSFGRLGRASDGRGCSSDEGFDETPGRPLSPRSSASSVGFTFSTNRSSARAKRFDGRKSTAVRREK